MRVHQVVQHLLNSLHPTPHTQKLGIPGIYAFLSAIRLCAAITSLSLDVKFVNFVKVDFINQKHPSYFKTVILRKN